MEVTLTWGESFVLHRYGTNFSRMHVNELGPSPFQASPVSASFSSDAQPLHDEVDIGEALVAAVANSTAVSASVPDWSREARGWREWVPSRSLLSSVRDYQRHAASRNPLRYLLLRRWAVIRHRFWSAVAGADIPLNSHIEGGLLLPHPNGVVIHPSAKIGPNCLFFQQVTIGARRGGVPSIGGHVDIGAGAKVLGAVHIGDHARIGANAVVLCDVPAGATAAGVRRGS